MVNSKIVKGSKRHSSIQSLNKLYLPQDSMFHEDAAPKAVLANVECGENYHRKSFKWAIMYSLLSFVYIIRTFSKSNTARSFQG